MRACLLGKRKSTFISRYLQTKHFLVKVEKNEKSDTWQNVKKKTKKLKHVEEEKDPTLVLGMIKIDWMGHSFLCPRSKERMTKIKLNH